MPTCGARATARKSSPSRAPGTRLGSLKSLLATCAAALAVLATAATASANDRFTLDPNPGSPGHVVVTGADTGYVAWTHRSGSSATDSVMFCAIPPGGTCSSPKTLTIPGAIDQADNPSGAFPVLGPGSTVFVVAPRYVPDDVVIWKSTDGGNNFEPGIVATAHAGYSGQSDPTGVEFGGGTFVIDGFNSGVGLSLQPEGGAAGTNLVFATGGSTIGGAAGGFLLGSPTVATQVYWTEDPPYQMYFFRYKGSGTATLASSWTGPTALGAGYETKVASGAGGIYLVSEDYAGGPNPSAIDVRKFDGTSFEAPVTLANDSGTDLFAGGAIAESSGGHVAVAWPGTRGTDQAKVMRLFTSPDGHSFAESEIAHLGGAYSIGENAQLGVTDSGAGWVTFIDEAGLHMADTAPIAPAPPPTPPTYKGKEKTIGKKLGNFELTLRVPQGCLQPGQPFYAGAGKRVRHKVAKAVHSKLTLKTATFSFDGKKLKTLKKKPLKLLISPGRLPAGSTHTVAVKITAVTRGHGKKKKKVVRTLKGTIKIC